MGSRVGPNEMLDSAASDLGLHCLLRPVGLILSGNKITCKVLKKLQMFRWGYALQRTN